MQQASSQGDTLTSVEWEGRLVTQQEKQLVVAATSLVLLWLSGALVSLFFGLVSAIVGAIYTTGCIYSATKIVHLLYYCVLLDDNLMTA